MIQLQSSATHGYYRSQPWLVGSDDSRGAQEGELRKLHALPNTQQTASRTPTAGQHRAARSLCYRGCESLHALAILCVVHAPARAPGAGAHRHVWCVLPCCQAPSLSQCTAPAVCCAALAIGLATENATLIPDAKDPRYSQYLKRRRTQASSQEQTKHRTRQLLAKDRRAVDEAVLSQPIGAMSSAAQRVNAAHMHSLAPGVNSEELAARRESAAVLDLFEVQAYWRVAVAMEFLPVGMNEKTVKETMAQHGTYHTSGKYRGCYSLREEFQSVKAKAVLQATAEADAALEAAAAAEGTTSGR